MSLFKSPRERRLWLGTFVVIAAIYATIGLAATLSGLLYNQALSAVIFVAGMFSIGVSILTQGLQIRPGGLEIGVGLGIAVVYIFLFFRMSIPERSHLIEYSVVAVLMYEALVERRNRGGSVPVPALVAVLATSLVGALDEFIQLFLPSRVFDPVDILFNFLAAVMAVVGVVVLGWARQNGRTVLARLRRKSSKPPHDEEDHGDD